MDRDMQEMKRRVPRMDEQPKEAEPQTTYGSMAGGRIRLQREGHINAPWLSEVSETPTSSIRPTMADEAEKQSGYHSDLATKAARACMFFRANPAFEEFIRLIRSGAIQL
jgi:hypothetical protein